MDFLSEDRRPERLVISVLDFSIITEWGQLPPTCNITPNLTRLILVASGRVIKDFKAKGLPKMIYQLQP
jgi:hypothetical protein